MGAAKVWKTCTSSLGYREEQIHGSRRRVLSGRPAAALCQRLTIGKDGTLYTLRGSQKWQNPLRFGGDSAAAITHRKTIYGFTGPAAAGPVVFQDRRSANAFVRRQRPVILGRRRGSGKPLHRNVRYNR